MLISTAWIPLPVSSSIESNKARFFSQVYVYLQKTRLFINIQMLENFQEIGESNKNK